MKNYLVSFVFLFSWPFASVGLADQARIEQFVDATISLEDPTVVYDSGYRRLEYPLGDVPPDVGVCSDVIIRAYRLVGIDLQQRVHEDMKKNFNAYPKLWGLNTTDKNIDHRRVPNLRMFFKRNGEALQIADNPDDYKPGDIVTWNLRQIGSLPHIGIVTDKRSTDGQRYLIMHNIGTGQVMADMLFDHEITGHYRYGLK